MPTTSLLRVRTSFAGLPGAPYLSTMYFSSADDPQDAVDAVGRFWTAMSGAMSSGLNWVTDADVPIIDAVSGDLQAVGTTTVVSGSGSVDGDQLPFASQGLVVWTTGAVVGTRQLIGHTFLPGACESASTSGVPNTSYLNTVGTALAAMPSEANPAPLVIWSRAHGQWEPANNAVISQKWAVLRSRRD